MSTQGPKRRTPLQAAPSDTGGLDALSRCHELIDRHLVVRLASCFALAEDICIAPSCSTRNAGHPLALPRLVQLLAHLVLAHLVLNLWRCI